MTRIVMTAVPASGHVNPSAPLVRELVRRGTHVTYYATEQFRPLVESLGAEFRAYPAGTVSSETIAAATAQGGSAKVVQRLLESTPPLVEFLRSQVCPDPPDAVMFDSNALWGRMLATDLERPGISVMTTILVGSSAFRALHLRELRPAVRESAGALTGILGARRRLQRSLGRGLLPPSPMFPTRGDLSIFPIPAWMQPPDGREDASCHFVGPTLDAGARSEEADPELAGLLAAGDPVVMVSLGTLHTGGEAFFRSCLEALGGLTARVLLVTGAGADPAGLGPLPPHLMVRETVPQLEVLRRASVFVTHGGMNSVLEALHFAVPMVVVPQQVEQLMIGQAVADRGAGTLLRQHLGGAAVPPEALREAVGALLEDRTYGASARSLSATLHEGGGAERAADLVEQLLGRSTAREGT